MPTLTMTVARIDQPKPGKKSGNIVGSDGTIVGAFPDKLGKFREGRTYEIDYSTNEWKDKVYKNLESFQEIEASKATTVTQFPAAAASTPQGSKYETCAKDAERMFVCSLMNAFIQAGKIEPNTKHIIDATNAVRQAWQRTFGESNTFHASEAGRAARG